MSLQKIKPNPPSKLTPSIYKNIVKILAKGNYPKVAAETLGLSERTIQQWIQIGKGEHPKKIAVEPYISFAKDVEQAKAKAEARLVDKLSKQEDWRAQKFLLEQGPARDRWGPSIPQPLQATPALAILDVLRTRSIAVQNGESVPPLELSEAKETKDAESRT
jgi:hypothetical protein